MPGQPIPSELKEKGLIWLLPPYCWSHRQIARKLKISASVVSKWRYDLVEQGLLPENEKITSVDVEDWTPERRFSVALETATLSEMELADYIADAWDCLLNRLKNGGLSQFRRMKKIDGKYSNRQGIA